jgi:hypothetical protein
VAALKEQREKRGRKYDPYKKRQKKKEWWQET